MSYELALLTIEIESEFATSDPLFLFLRSSAAAALLCAAAALGQTIPDGPDQTQDPEDIEALVNMPTTATPARASSVWHRQR